MSDYFPDFSPRFRKSIEALSGKTVVVIGHARPDGDCIGSQVALTRLLRNQGVEVVCVNADPCPQSLLFIAEESPFDVLNFERIEALPLIFVDCADELRIGPETSKRLAGNEFLLNIDHHISNTNYASTNFVSSSSSATCELLAGMALDLGWEIDALTAEALYTGIMTDTGRFGYVATSSQVFDICSTLVKCGAEPAKISNNLYENNPFSRLKLLERYLNSLKVCFDGKVCYGVLTQKDFAETQSVYEQTEGFVDYARSVVGVEIGIIMEERKTTVKGSLRAENAQMRVDQIAAKLGGGGHACAAGLSSNLSLSELETSLLEEVGKRFDIRKGEIISDVK
ncbi:DHH family phosphoesterase [Puniceicoccaceae bacterium K14]|nr:DHH family phosphoesterase [Puniceicoccaceae bacterium K14]